MNGLISARKKIFCKDESTTDIKKYFEEGIEFIEKHITKGNVLVHCIHGRSRSPSMAIAYMMYTKKIPFDDAMGILKSQFDSVKPNTGFVKQLREYEL